MVWCMEAGQLHITVYIHRSIPFSIPYSSPAIRDTHSKQRVVDTDIGLELLLRVVHDLIYDTPTRAFNVVILRPYMYLHI